MDANVLIAHSDKIQFGDGKKMVLDMINAAEGEVFTREEVQKALPSYMPSSVAQYLETLNRKGEIGNVKFEKKTYYGNKKIIEKITAKAKKTQKKKFNVNGKK